uniref:Putative secreted protein n=1 Tax=Anopheles darlingi TaxID=43151 RepID=A0A2M4DMI0_ANODA
MMMFTELAITFFLLLPRFLHCTSFASPTVVSSRRFRACEMCGDAMLYICYHVSVEVLDDVGEQGSG